MKIKKMRVMGNDTGHHFEDGAEVLLIQDFYIDSGRLITDVKTCLGEQSDGFVGRQLVLEDNLEFVEDVEFDTVIVKDFFQDVSEVKAADFGCITDLGFPEVVHVNALKEMQNLLETLGKPIVESAEKIHLIVGKDSDDDFVYSIVPETNLAF